MFLGVNLSGSLVWEEVVKVFEECLIVWVRVILYNEERKICLMNIIILSLFWVKFVELI